MNKLRLYIFINYNKINLITALYLTDFAKFHINYYLELI